VARAYPIVTRMAESRPEEAVVGSRDNFRVVTTGQGFVSVSEHPTCMVRGPAAIKKQWDAAVPEAGPRCINFRCKSTVSLAQGVSEWRADRILGLQIVRWIRGIQQGRVLQMKILAQAPPIVVQRGRGHQPNVANPVHAPSTACSALQLWTRQTRPSSAPPSRFPQRHHHHCRCSWSGAGQAAAGDATAWRGGRGRVGVKRVDRSMATMAIKSAGLVFVSAVAVGCFVRERSCWAKDSWRR